MKSALAVDMSSQQPAREAALEAENAFLRRQLAALAQATGQVIADQQGQPAPPEVVAATLGESDAYWRDVFEHLSEGFILGEAVRDADGVVIDWRYLAVNSAWEALVGVPRNDTVGRLVSEVFPGIEQGWIEDAAIVVNTRGPRTFLRGVAGINRWYEGHAFYLEGDRFAALFFEVTDRKRAEDESRHLVRLVEQSTDFIAVADQDGAMRFVNPAGLRLVGLADMHAAYTTRLLDYFTPSDHETVTATVMPGVRRNGYWEGTLNFQDFVTEKNFPVLFTIFPLRDAAGSVNGWGTVTRDMREHRGAEARRAALLELGDTLRDLSQPEEMAAAASRIMARALGASRAGYGTVDAASESITIADEWMDDGFDSIAGTYFFREYGEYIEDLRAGRTVVVVDAARDPRTPADAAGWQAAGVVSALNHPIFEHGAFVALFFLHDFVPRAWSADEIAFVRNVADRTRSEMQRRRAEIGLRAMAASLEAQVAERTADRNRLWELSSDIMLVLRFDGIVAAVNPAWQAMLGWTEEELVGRTLIGVIHPDDLEKTIQAGETLAAGGRISRFDNRYRHKAGGYRWISWAAVPGGGVINAVGRDFTEEKFKTEALELSEGRLRSVFDTTFQFQGLMTTEGIMLDINPMALESIESSLEDIVGTPFWNTPFFTATPGMQEMVEAAIPGVAAGATFRQEVVVNLPTGRRAFDFAMRPVLNAAGAVIAIVPQAMELTERRAAEERLRQAQKMEAVGQLTGGLAHDFNNLLTGVTAGLDVLRTRLAQGRLEDAERYIAAAESAAHRAATLTHRLLTFSRQETLDPQTIWANTLVTGMVELIQRTVGPTIKVQTALSDGIWPMLCDFHQLENALLNLAINARDAMTSGGRLTIATENRIVDETTARQKDMDPGEYVLISVTDTGSGMQPDVIARAFDPFFTTKPLGQGTGLGLSMVYGFAKQSGGQARIQSAIGQGTTVRIYLPRQSGAASMENPADSMAGATVAEDSETVLVVDDEPFVAMLITDVLEELGYTAIEASDGDTGLKVLRSDRRIDLLITDVGLPGGMSGRQLADAARELRPDLKVLFVTGYAENGVLGDGQMADGMQVITKPFALEALAARITSMITGE